MLFRALTNVLFIIITIWAIRTDKRLKNLEKVVKHYIVDRKGEINE